MKCSNCLFRSQIDDTGLVDSEGNALPVFRCVLMQEFKLLSHKYCYYLLEATRFSEDVARSRLVGPWADAGKKVMEHIEELNSTLLSLPLSQQEQQFLLRYLVRIDPIKTRLVARLTEWSTGRTFKTTRAECGFLYDFVRLGVDRDPEETVVMKNLLLKLENVVDSN